MKNGNTWLPKDIRQVPQLRRNLIYVGQLDALGDNVTGGAGALKVTKRSLVISKGYKSGTLYVLQGQTEVEATLGVADSGIELWHKMLGHMSKKGIEILHKKNQLSSLKVVDMYLCEHCIYKKQKRKTNSTKEHMKKTRPLELVHSDVFGLSKVASIGRSTYFVTFMVDWTRKFWIYMMKKNYEVFGIFKTFKELVENQTSSKIKWSKFDNGGEYCLN